MIIRIISDEELGISYFNFARCQLVVLEEGVDVVMGALKEKYPVPIQCFPLVTGFIFWPPLEPREALARETRGGVTPCPARSAKFLQL